MTDPHSAVAAPSLENVTPSFLGIYERGIHEFHYGPPTIELAFNTEIIAQAHEFYLLSTLFPLLLAFSPQATETPLDVGLTLPKGSGLPIFFEANVNSLILTIGAPPNVNY